MENKTAMQVVVDKLEDTNLTMYDIYTYLQMHKNELLEKEKQQIIDFHIEVMKIGLIDEGDKKWQDAYHPKIKETATNYYNETFKNK